MFRLIDIFPETKNPLKIFLETQKMKKREAEMLVQWAISIR